MDFDGIWFGADYNPEQWPESIWDTDIRLMQEAKVNVVSLGIFSWALIEPEEGRFEFGWLDRIMEKLAAAGIQLDLATATASPPPWVARAYPESLPVTADGVRLEVGSRQQYCPSSGIVRELSARLVRRIAERYGDHPGLALWHVGNEYGCHVSRCYCETSAAAFRAWLSAKYGDIESLNRSWATTFWSQHYNDFDEVTVPRATPAFPNPGQSLDFARFSSDEMLDCYLNEVMVLREVTPDVPVTTNFMGFHPGCDLWKWAEHVDIVSNDSYPDPADPRSPALSAMGHDLMRSLGGGAPWILMEQAAGAVNWRTRNMAKRRGEMRAYSLQAVARGANGVLYFQWRQSVAGAEMFHSGMVPHAGTNTRLWRSITELGAELGTMANLVNAGVEARVALVADWQSWWALGEKSLPADISYTDSLFSWYRELWRRDVAVDFARPGTDLRAYDLVIVPTLFCASAATLDTLDTYVRGGGHLVVTYQSGIVDESFRLTEGGYLGALQKTLGVRVEEFSPFAGPDPLSHNTPAAPAGRISGALTGDVDCHIWGEYLHTQGAEVLASFAVDDLHGWPAITRNSAGAGVAWYVATQPGDETMHTLVGRMLGDAGIDSATVDTSPDVEIVQRGASRFTIDHVNQSVTVEDTSASL